MATAEVESPARAPSALAAALRRALRRHGVLSLSLGLNVGGWAWMWAQSLGILSLGPIWLPVGAFALGLALIPLAIPRRGRHPAAGGSPPGRSAAGWGGLSRALLRCSPRRDLREPPRPRPGPPR